jgi:transcriptional regulator with XRE-family HTH domain
MLCGMTIVAATKLDAWMKATGTRDRELAELCGCDRSLITKIRNGYTPKLWLAVKLADGDGVAERDFLYDSGDES